MLSLLAYPPVLRGFVVLLAASFSFPVAGVWVIRLNLLPYRFMLMHGALLGGAIAMAAGWTPLPAVVGVNILLVFAANGLIRRLRLDAGLATVFLMVASLGGAMALVYAAEVPAQDTLAILWGNIFAVGTIELAATLTFAVAVGIFTVVFEGPVTAVIYDRRIAFTAGVDDGLVHGVLLGIIALTVAFAMRVVGALLLDALLLLPAILASLGARSVRSLYRRAVLIGGALGTAGFLLALIVDLPVGAAVALVGAGALVFTLPFSRRKHDHG